MGFGSKIRRLREEKKWTQQNLADELGVSLRTISSYENKDQRPRVRRIYERLSELFNVNINYLLADEEFFMFEPGKNYGPEGRKEAEEIVNGMLGLFAGGEIPMEDKKVILDALQEAYYVAKQKNESSES